MKPETEAQKLKLTIVQSFIRFTKIQAFSGILLIFTTVVAIIWANSPWYSSYFELWQTNVTVGFGSYSLSKPLLLWINDGLMALFFFVVGLEIKREIIFGELSSFKKASLPVFAALGGMIVPAIIYVIFNYNEPSAHGWGVPMATDIAFSLGILALLGSRVPISLKVFLTALAIADDLGAVIVIALFYSSEISLLNILIGAIFLFAMVAGNYLGVRNKWFYAVLGIGGLWLAFLLSGVHATIAGILAAFTIPTSSGIKPNEYGKEIKGLLNKFDIIGNKNTTLLTFMQLEVIATVKATSEDVEPPLQSLEHTIHPWITYIVMPMFALSNAGLILSSDSIQLSMHPVSVGIFFGLLVGKSLGITLFSFLSYKLGWASLPKNVKWVHILGLAFIAGIGFTMSLFISGLAFVNVEYQIASKLGIFAGSVISGILGFMILRSTLNANKDQADV